MIQRIQSIYLFFTAILMAVTVFSPLIQLGQSVLFLFNGIKPFNSELPNSINYILYIALIFTMVSAIIALISIFMYKNRKRQLKVCKMNSLVIVLIYAILGVYIFMLSQAINIEFNMFRYGFILPLIALIFNIIAISKIKADEKLVQSLNRIR